MIVKIGIIGLGVVGSAIKHGFEKLGHKTAIHDIRFDTSIRDVKDTEVVFLCVPTPSLKNHKCDVSVVESVIKELNDIDYKGVISIKSTVEPGFTEQIQEKYRNRTICFVPEFLRERCAIADFTENHDLCVIGTDDDKVFEVVKLVHGKYPDKVIKLSPTEAEFVKYFNNIYNATLITFANSFYEICKSQNVDYTNVKDAIIHRDHINDIYLDCNENFRGFGGMCLPKDTSAIAALVKELNLDIKFFDTILSENEKYKTTVFNGMRE
jgi:UDPglucose 6-dehydrogenase